MILRKTVLQDLPTLFEFQSDPDTIAMAAFTAPDPQDRTAYMAKWSALLDKEGVHLRSVFVDEDLVGQVLSYEIEGEAQVSYGIDRKHWGKGYATTALKLFLAEFSQGPYWGRVAFDNLPSKKVLEKCGFKYLSTEQYHSNARGKEIDEWVYKLDR